MKKVNLGTSQIHATSIILGCLRLTSADEPSELIQTAYEQGINFFDHADIYGAGECEIIFGKVINESAISRDDIIIQTKCGICKGRFDFSKEHIIASVENSLKRLSTEYIDGLLLHRPDALVEPEEVAAAFEQLEKQGKVRYFGVSNHKPSQIDLLKQAVKQPLLVNQLQFGLKHTTMIDQGLHVNMNDSASINRDNSLIDYSRMNQMTIQAWSPYQYGFFEGTFLDNPDFNQLNEKLNELAEKYQSTPVGIATAWILRHPANMQVVVGTMNQQRLKTIAQASSIVLTREEWYSLYCCAGNELP